MDESSSTVDGKQLADGAVVVWERVIGN